MKLRILEYPETRSPYAFIFHGRTQSIEGVKTIGAIWSEAKAWFEDHNIPMILVEDYMSRTLDPARWWSVEITDPDQQFEFKMRWW